VFVLQSPLTPPPLKTVIAQLMPPLILLQMPDGRTVMVRTGNHASPPRKVYLSHKFLGMMEGGNDRDKKMKRAPRAK